MCHTGPKVRNSPWAPLGPKPCALPFGGYDIGLQSMRTSVVLKTLAAALSRRVLGFDSRFLTQNMSASTASQQVHCEGRDCCGHMFCISFLLRISSSVGISEDRHPQHCPGGDARSGPGPNRKHRGPIQSRLGTGKAWNR